MAEGGYFLTIYVLISSKIKNLKTEVQNSPTRDVLPNNFIVVLLKSKVSTVHVVSRAGFRTPLAPESFLHCLVSRNRTEKEQNRC